MVEGYRSVRDWRLEINQVELAWVVCREVDYIVSKASEVESIIRHTPAHESRTWSLRKDGGGWLRLNDSSGWPQMVGSYGCGICRHALMADGY